MHVPVPRVLPPTVEEMPTEDSQYQQIAPDPIPNLIYQVEKKTATQNAMKNCQVTFDIYY